MARIITIDGRQWVAGMSWCSFEDPPSMDELRDDAERLHSDWYAVRVGESVVQAGFCPPIDGISRPRKIYSLAAMLADSREQPWLGIFRIAEGLWWYVAVRDHHAILPDGDVIGGEDQIHAARDRHAGYTDWKYIEGTLDDLTRLMAEITEPPSAVKSLTVSAVDPAVVYGSIATLAALLGAGAWWYHEQGLEALQERAVAMERMRAQLTKGAPPVAVASPLLTTPTPNTLLDACYAQIRSLPISRDGWLVKDVECSQTALTVAWARGGGATVVHRPEGELNNGDSIVQTIALSGLRPAGVDDAVDLATGKIALWKWAQGAGITVSMDQRRTAAAQLPGTTSDEAPATPTSQLGVKFDLQVSPFSLDLRTIPGFRITSIKATASGWTIDGALYGRK